MQVTELHSRFGDKQIILSFQKWQSGPLMNGKEPIFVAFFHREYVSDQAVRLTFSNFGKVASVFNSRHKFNRYIRNGNR